MAPAPTVISVVAANPSGDNVYGATDTITFTFSEPLRSPQPLDRLRIINGFGPSHNLGAVFSGQWISNSQFRITIDDATGHNVSLSTLQFVIADHLGLRADANLSYAVSGVTPAISGAFAATPSVVSVTAVGRSIMLAFNVGVNKGGSMTQSDINMMLQPDFVLGASYSAYWISPTTLNITIYNMTGSTLAIGVSRFDINGMWQLRNAAETSAFLSGLTPRITGIAAPMVTSVVAINTYNDLQYAWPDMINITFDQPTNFGVQGLSVIRSDLILLLQPRFELGSSYGGRWITPTVLQITIFMGDGANATIGAVLFDINPEFGLQNAAGTSLFSSGPTPAITGSWIATAVPAPTVLSVTGWNPLNGSTHTGAEVFIVFSTPTNRGVLNSTYSMISVNSWLQPSASLGTAYTAAWISGTTIRLSIQNGTGATAETGSLRFNISASADIRVATNNSLQIQGNTPAMVGSFYFVPCTLVCVIVSLHGRHLNIACSLVINYSVL